MKLRWDASISFGHVMTVVFAIIPFAGMVYATRDREISLERTVANQQAQIDKLTDNQASVILTLKEMQAMEKELSTFIKMHLKADPRLAPLENGDK